MGRRALRWDILHKQVYDVARGNRMMKGTPRKLVREVLGGEPYEYYPVGRHIVVALGVCGGRPTFKYTRIDVRHALRLLASGRPIEQIAKGYRVPITAVQEALTLTSC
jgi:uncharacterized protein (DUF433 family)